MKKIIYFSLGLICLVLGTIGIVLPILPTTPLLLAGAWFFARSSQRFHSWLLNHRILGQYIRDYIEKKAVKKTVRNRALLILWSGMLLSMFITQKQTVIIILTIIGVIVTIHLLMLTVLPENSGSNLPEES